MTIQIQKVLHLKKELGKKNPKLSGLYLITEKIDGWYSAIIYNKELDTWQAPISSAGRVIPAFEHTVEQFNRLPKPKHSGMLIAEAYIPDTPFPILNGLFNRSVGNYACQDVQFMAHDWVDFEEPTLSAKDRFHILMDALYTSNVSIINPATLLGVTEYHQKLWEQYYLSVLDRGGEGIVCKRATAPYSFGKRNSDLLKLKAECMIDCLAVRYEITEGDKGNDGFTLVSKRKSGVEIRTVINSHKIQNILLNNPEQILGKVVTISGMEEYPDTNIRQPVFKYVREDKAIDDYD